MPTINWPAHPVDATRRLLLFSHPGEAQALAVHAFWTTQSLWYLDDIDGPTQARFPAPINGEHDAHVVDIAHVRWAATSAITALDLCAASLGLAFCGRRLDQLAASVRHFDATDVEERARPRIERFRSRLPVDFRAWVDAVIADTRYVQMLAARNPTTHARLTRHLHMSADRTKFAIDDGEPVRAPDFIRTARDLASDHCLAFMRALLRLPVPAT